MKKSITKEFTIFHSLNLSPISSKLRTRTVDNRKDGGEDIFRKRKRKLARHWTRGGKKEEEEEEARGKILQIENIGIEKRKKKISDKAHSRVEYPEPPHFLQKINPTERRLIKVEVKVNRN